MMIRATVTVLAIFCIAAQANLKSYNGYKVLRVLPTMEEHFKALKSLENNGYDFWMRPSQLGKFADLMLSPEQHAQVEKRLQDLGMETEVMIPDVEELIATEKRILGTRQNPGMSWDTYHRLSEIYTWLDSLVTSQPGLVSTETYGYSTEGRSLRIFKISTNSNASLTPSRPAFYIDATIHAREWISTAVATYIVNELVNNTQKYADILNSVDFYVIPMINPDGYEFSHVSDRLWRKTRSNYFNYTGNCLGVDCNRNFGFHWGEEAGSSTNPCSLTYQGPNAFSEPESRSLQEYIFSKSASINWTVFITLHSYSQLWMTPYGYSATELPVDFDELKNLSDVAVNALTSVHNTTYITGNAAQILYTSSGTSRDWAKGQGGFKYVYTIELRDTGNYGFVLPPNQIIPTAEETWAGIQVVARHIVP